MENYKEWLNSYYTKKYIEYLNEDLNNYYKQIGHNLLEEKQTNFIRGIICDLVQNISDLNSGQWKEKLKDYKQTEEVIENE